MFARTGDRIEVLSIHPDGPIRDAVVLAVDHEDGSPPYRVRWFDTGRETLLFPEPDAYVDHRTAPAGTGLRQG
jgi:hypothetical protein